MTLLPLLKRVSYRKSQDTRWQLVRRVCQLRLPTFLNFNKHYKYIVWIGSLATFHYSIATLHCHTTPLHTPSWPVHVCAVTSYHLSRNLHVSCVSIPIRSLSTCIAYLFLKVYHSFRLWVLALSVLDCWFPYSRDPLCPQAGTTCVHDPQILLYLRILAIHLSNFPLFLPLHPTWHPLRRIHVTTC